jgi:hypothetical protein
MEQPTGQQTKAALPRRVAGLHPFRARGVEEGQGGDLVAANLSENRSPRICCLIPIFSLPIAVDTAYYCGWQLPDFTSIISAIILEIKK